MQELLNYRGGTSLSLPVEALAGMAAFGLVDAAAPASAIRNGAAPCHMARASMWAASTPHNQNHTVRSTTVMYTGLTDLDQQGNIVPGIAESWEPNQELTAWTFRLRKGVLFHNGREVDAEAVKLNIMRIKDPAIGGDWERGAIDTIDSVEVSTSIRCASMRGAGCVPAVERHALPDAPDGARRLRHGGRPPHRHGPVQVRLLDAQ